MEKPDKYEGTGFRAWLDRLLIWLEVKSPGWTYVLNLVEAYGARIIDEVEVEHIRTHLTNEYEANGRVIGPDFFPNVQATFYAFMNSTPKASRTRWL